MSKLASKYGKQLAAIYERKIRPHGRKILIGLVVFFAVFTLTGFLVLPPLVKSLLIKELSGNLHREVAIREVKINPYTLSLTVRGLLIKERTGADTFVSCDEMFLNLQSTSLLRLALILKEVRVVKPYVLIRRNQDLSYNFSDLLEKAQPVVPEKAKPKPLKFSLNNIRVENGSVDFLDIPQNTKHVVRDLKIGVPFLSNIASYVERFVQPHLSATVNGAFYSLQGRTKPFADSLETYFEVGIKDLNVPYYLTYVPMKTKLKIVSAYLDLSATVSFIETKDRKSSLTVTGTVSGKDMRVDDAQGGPLLRLPLLEVSVAPSEPLLGKIHLSSVAIQSPEVNIQRDAKGVLNTESILVQTARERAAKRRAGEAPPVYVDIDALVLSKGKVSFSDLSRHGGFRTILDPVDLKVDHFSNSKDRKAAYALSFVTEAKESVKSEGELSVDPLTAAGTLEAASVTLKKYGPFYRDAVLLDIEDGRLDLSTRYRFASGEKEPQLSLSGIAVALKALRLKTAGEGRDFLAIPSLSIRETDLDFTGKRLEIGNFSTEKGELVVRRSRNGDVNILTLTPPASAPGEPAGKPKADGKAVEPERPWLISVKQMLVDNYTVRMEDQATRDQATLVAQNLRLKTDNISTARNNKGRLDLSLLLNGKGRVSTTGTVSLEPLSLDLRTDLKGIDVAPFQPYFTDRVKITVTGGAVSSSGRLSLAFSDKKEIKAAYKGQAVVANFSSIDRVSEEDLLKFESLALSELNVRYAPLFLDIKGVSLTNFYARVAVDAQGNINLQEVLTAEEPKAGKPPGPARQETTAATAAPTEKRETSRNIRIDQVTLQGGRIDFEDRSVKPPFSTHLSEMGGRVSGLSAEERTVADVELRAKLNDYAPLEITGKINPLKDDLFVDLKARIKDLDLSPATPYSGKYAGYTIEKGKLSVDVRYSIDKRRLNSQNDVFLDQFNFGEKVESPQATHLPVKLAVALLKDRNGVIKLDLPVSGSLDDPKFSVGRIILQVLINLITKAATSPFALLGAAFGGHGEELSFVEFGYGSAAITEPNVKKLDTVSKAIQDRPSLKLDIEGHADMDRDRDGLKEYLLARKVKAQKLNEMVKKGQPAVPVDEVKIESAEYEKYLRMAYKEEKFPKPRNIIGVAKDIPPSEMEKLMLTHITVNEGDLRTLASRRAMNVRDQILKSGHVEPERVFIVEPKVIAAEKKDTLKESRVELKLRS